MVRIIPQPVTSPKATSRLNSRELPLRGRVTGCGIIVIHGRGTKPSRTCKLGYIREVLTESVRRVDPKAGRWLTKHPQTIQLAYYADLVRRLTGARPETCHSYRQPIDRLFIESRSCPTWTKFRGFLRDLGADVVTGLARVLSLQARRRLINRYFADVVRYLSDHAFASSIKSRLQRLLVPSLRRHERILLIAHSLGSVVAYDVLWKLSHMSEYAHLRDRKVDGFITMGSPLGDETVRAHLLGWRYPHKQRYPTNIKRWVNLSARGDIISHDARLANDFRPMLRLGYLELLEDRTGLCTVYRGRDGDWNPHKLYGYLILPELGRLIAEHLHAHCKVSWERRP